MKLNLVKLIFLKHFEQTLSKIDTEVDFLFNQLIWLQNPHFDLQSSYTDRQRDISEDFEMSNIMGIISGHTITGQSII